MLKVVDFKVTQEPEITVGEFLQFKTDGFFEITILKNGRRYRITFGIYSGFCFRGLRVPKIISSLIPSFRKADKMFNIAVAIYTAIYSRSGFGIIDLKELREIFFGICKIQKCENVVKRFLCKFTLPANPLPTIGSNDREISIVWEPLGIDNAPEKQEPSIFSDWLTTISMLVIWAVLALAISELIRN